MNNLKIVVILLWMMLASIGVIAQEQEEEELPVIPYFQSYAFNVPVLTDWEDQSTETIAQYYHPDAQVTIRTHHVYVNDSREGIKQDLEDLLGTTLSDPLYNESVNLADGTWAVVVYQVDDNTTASAMARQQDGRTFVISFVEDNPDVNIFVATIAHAEDSEQEDPTPEMAFAVEQFTSASVSDLSEPETMILPSGEWTSQTADDVQVMGWVFGNDSYLTIANGAVDNLPELANAYNTTLLGFFVTPDNSNYLIMGLVASLGTLAILAFSIYWRSRSLQKDLAVIQQLAEEE